MKFRLRAFGTHLLASAVILTLVLGGLYAGWYRWPGWYLTSVPQVLGMLALVDLAIGPLLTLVIASPGKPRRELTRDVAIIVLAQMIALGYGTSTLWSGRPLYYAFSENVLQVVQGYDLDPDASAAARERRLDLAPHWYSLPRWIWAPLPWDQQDRDRIVGSALKGGFDVVALPGYFRPWQQGLGALRTQLANVDEIKFFSLKEKEVLKERMRADGLPTDQKNAIPFTGRGRPLLAVFDPATLEIRAILAAG